jgi:hypothetical protein
VQQTGSFVPGPLTTAATELAYLVVIRGELITTTELDVVASVHTINPLWRGLDLIQFFVLS